MDGLTLILRARAAGLTVRADGHRLVIRGPRHAERFAAALLAANPEVMAVLRATESVNPVVSKWAESGLGTLQIVAVVARPPVSVGRYFAPGFDPVPGADRLGERRTTP